MPDAPHTAGANFTPQERALLSRYVTSTDGSVFALTNLPEVIKGALFSRYSRSTLGLRELLLKEFIADPEAEFAAIGGQGPGGAADPEAAARDAHLAVARAQDFYGRILDGYGDDSIGELGGAHLAIENVSMIATKVLEDARIGGSPLEKSTRYVYFAEQHGGDFLFYKEPTLLASAHGERYLATCRMLFQTYRDLIGPLTAYVEAAWPRPERTSEGAWKRSVRARVFDGLRGLLPAAALTNMGIFGNGRFFETLLMRLQVAPLAELQTLGTAMHGELAKVIPAFVRRAQPENPHFGAYRAFQQDLDAWVAHCALPGAPDEPPTAPEQDEVTLVDWDPQAPAKVLAALAYGRGPQALATLRAAADRMSPEAQAERLAALAELRGNRRHKPPRALELAEYTFDLTGDFGMYRDLHRHRMLTQQRQPLGTRLGFDLPEEVREAGLAEPFARAMNEAAATWETIAADHPAEAQYAVPMAYRIRWQMHANLRALIWLTELRSQAQGHPAYRRMAQALYRRVAEAHPAFAPLFKFVDLDDHPLGRIGAEQRQEDKQSARAHAKG